MCLVVLLSHRNAQHKLIVIEKNEFMCNPDIKYFVEEVEVNDC